MRQSRRKQRNVQRVQGRSNSLALEAIDLQTVCNECVLLSSFFPSTPPTATVRAVSFLFASPAGRSDHVRRGAVSLSLEWRTPHNTRLSHTVLFI